jgi:hypothetical protein
MPKLPGERGLMAQVLESPRLNPADSNPCRTAIRPHGWLRRPPRAGRPSSHGGIMPGGLRSARGRRVSPR